MSGQQKKREQLKQQLLDQIQMQQEAIESLSDEELESVAGGIMATINLPAGAANHVISRAINTAPINTFMAP